MFHKLSLKHKAIKHQLCFTTHEKNKPPLVLLLFHWWAFIFTSQRAWVCECTSVCGCTHSCRICTLQNQFFTRSAALASLRQHRRVSWSDFTTQNGSINPDHVSVPSGRGGGSSCVLDWAAVTTGQRLRNRSIVDVEENSSPTSNFRCPPILSIRRPPI